MGVGLEGGMVLLLWRVERRGRERRIRGLFYLAADFWGEGKEKGERGGKGGGRVEVLNAGGVDMVGCDERGGDLSLCEGSVRIWLSSRMVLVRVVVAGRIACRLWWNPLQVL